MEPEPRKLREPPADHLRGRQPEEVQPAARGGDDDARRPETECRLVREARPVGLVVLKQEEPSSDVVLREPLLDHQRAARHQLERARMRDLIVAVDAERPALLAPMVNGGGTSLAASIMTHRATATCSTPSR